MAQRYESRMIFSSEVEQEIMVTSSRCIYKVWITDNEISIDGPGVDESYYKDNAPDLDGEDLAIWSILMFENGIDVSD